MNLISRKQAAKKGLKRFFTGELCCHNHIAERYTGCGHCTKCVCERIKKRYKEDETFRKKQNEYRKKYGILNNQKLNEQAKKWRTEHPEENKEIKRQAYLKNKIKYIKKAKEWANNNLEICRKIKRKWKINNPDSIAIERIRRRNYELMAMPIWADKEKIKRIYIEARKNGMHVDHIIPLRSNLVCGLHVENNLQLLPAKENLKKGNRIIKEALL